ncbi:MauE/DoxX family redox-associated membrane protein [Pedobacter punctiformis]|uniref:Methylamine utilisation protein MauE domain-containing protein n=1 Tax=Pedobacter punctiformis TaxID=3004097 RepID=A0ABT4L8Q2_9SPHI|nr:MauE/DoxX family redox-associated membrane protein [Pedobacter sp. HCMS5-2]MCZ4243543.1 hypothetical protein [Pedobacter sp. HCMS5-2]
MKQNLLTPCQVFNGILFLLVLLWVYTACSKLLSFDTFKHELSMQHLLPDLLNALSYLLPAIELLTVALLMIPLSRKSGLILSLFLLVLFTIYILLILAGYFENKPCSCGGVLKILGWKTHLLFNLFFITINAIGLYLFTQEERRQLKNSKIK